MDGYGAYRPVAARRFESGDEFHVYVELSGVHVASSWGGTFTTNLGMSCSIVDSNGKTISQLEFPTRRRSSGVLPRRFHLAGKVKLDDNIPAGNYQLKLVASDDTKGASKQLTPTVETTLDFIVLDR